MTLNDNNDDNKEKRLNMKQEDNKNKYSLDPHINQNDSDNKKTYDNSIIMINLEPTEQLLIKENEKNFDDLNTNGTIIMKCDNNYKPSSNEETKIQTGYKRYLGITLGLCSSLAFSLAMLVVKLLKDYHPSTIGVWRFTGIFTPSIPLLLFCRYGMKKPVFDPIWPMNEIPKFKMGMGLLFRGIFGGSAIVLQYYSVTFMELADATVIAFSTPVFVSLLARIFLGEKCGIVPVIVALLTLFGVIIIARPPLLTGEAEFDEDNLIGTILSFSSMIFATAVFVILRYLREVHFSLVTSTFGLIGILECGIVCIIVSKFDIPHTPWDWFLGLSLAGLTYIGQSFITLAFKFEQAGPIALIRTFDVVFSFVWQFIFLGVYPDVFSLLGSSIVISSVILIGLRKALSSLPEDNPNRLRYWFLLK